MTQNKPVTGQFLMQIVKNHPVYNKSYFQGSVVPVLNYNQNLVITARCPPSPCGPPTRPHSLRHRHPPPLVVILEVVVKQIWIEDV